MDIKSYYTNLEVHSEGIAPWHYKIIELIKPNSIILEVGAGTGDFDVLIQKEKNCIIHCIDYSISNANKLKEKGLLSYRLDVENEKLPFEDNCFDQVLFIEVIEHLFCPNLILNEIYRVLKPKGELILSTPNAVNFIRRLNCFLFGEVHPMNDLTSTNGEHIRLYNHRIINKLFNKHGFNNILDKSWFKVPKVSSIIEPKILKSLFTQHILVKATK